MNADQLLSLGVFAICVVNICVIVRGLLEQRRQRMEALAILERLEKHIDILDEHFKHIIDAYKEFRDDDWWRKE